MINDDGFKDIRAELGSEDVEILDNFLAAFGMGPNYIKKESKKYNCSKCNGKNAVYKEFHADTDMNEILLDCPDCGHTEDG